MMSRPRNEKRHQRSDRLLRQEGMTLIEIMIVVIIMTMIATGVAVAVIPRLEKARIDTAKSNVSSIRTAVQLYLAENASKCPSMDELLAERYLDKGKNTKDPWDNDFIISCQAGEDPDVYSTGPDGQEGTEDDVH
jgi:general secretion pathway protein G